MSEPWSKTFDDKVKPGDWNETFEPGLATCTQAVDGRIVAVEDVPLVCQETGETPFSPETGDRLPALIRARLSRARVMETPVHEFGMAEPLA